MTTFHQRLGEFVQEMGTLQKQMADLLSVNPKSFSAYVSSRRTPTYEGLIEIADKTGLSLDWLTGRGNRCKWNDQIEQTRNWISLQAEGIQAPDAHGRCIAVVKLLQDQSEQCRLEWWMTGILGLPQFEDALNRWLRREATVTATNIKRLAIFTHISELWFITGDPIYLQRTDTEDEMVQSAIRLLSKLREVGITPEDLEGNLPRIEQLVKQVRKLFT